MNVNNWYYIILYDKNDNNEWIDKHKDLFM